MRGPRRSRIPEVFVLARFTQVCYVSFFIYIYIYIYIGALAITGTCNLVSLRIQPPHLTITSANEQPGKRKGILITSNNHELAWR